MLKKVLVIVPAYNEARHIEAVLDKLKSANFRNVVVIDDGSSDNTAFLAKKKKATVIIHEINRGMGAATQTGITWGILNDFNYFLTIDGDGQQTTEDLKSILNKLKKSPCVIGSRFLKRNNIPLFRYVANKIANILTGVFFGVWITDSQSGLRGFNKEVAKSLNLNSDGFEFCSDFVREVNFNGFEIKEIPISVIYSAQTMDKGQNLAEGLKTFGKLCLRAIMR
jgi:glycosyltransferase involved in cell wall biosynthesis